jgi:hypothetical protein
VPLRAPLCSFKQVFKANLEIPLHLAGRTLWSGQDGGCVAKVLLMAETSTGC